jgi:hypothetical protein
VVTAIAVVARRVAVIAPVVGVIVADVVVVIRVARRHVATVAANQVVGRADAVEVDDAPAVVERLVGVIGGAVHHRLDGLAVNARVAAREQRQGEGQ